MKAEEVSIIDETCEAHEISLLRIVVRKHLHELSEKLRREEVIYVGSPTAEEVAVIHQAVLKPASSPSSFMAKELHQKNSQEL